LENVVNSNELTAYQAACQAIYESWLREDQDPVLAEHFDTEYLPEPYLDFGDVDGDICLFLTTNPGGGMNTQLHDGISQLASGTLPQKYAPLSKIMADFYETSGELKGAPLANIRAMRGIADALGFSRVLQVEMIPWHSATLPKKSKVLQDLKDHPNFQAYAATLRALIDSATVVLSWSGGTPDKRGGDGVEFKSAALRLNLDAANMFEITRTTKPSQALFWSKQNEKIRGLFVNRAAANLPKRLDSNGDDRYAQIADIMRSL
jgi:hypothetical protein